MNRATHTLSDTCAPQAAQVADALEAAYQECRVLHRQITPDYLVLDWQGHLKVTGFGLARAQNVPPMTAGTELVGSLVYASPEHLWGRPLDHRSDLYALGVVLYEMVTGTRPFADRTFRDLAQAITAGRLILPTEVVPELSPELEYILLTALATNPDERFAHAGMMAGALRTCLFHTHALTPGSLVEAEHPFVEGELPMALASVLHEQLPGQHPFPPLIGRWLTLPMRAPQQSSAADTDLSDADTEKRAASQPKSSAWHVEQQGNREQSA